uniref:Uncharacterized protein n=1 Tax=Xenopus tropicalis TaxID=8364 RepID=A0A1B8XY01_XENTR
MEWKQHKEEGLCPTHRSTHIGGEPAILSYPPSALLSSAAPVAHLLASPCTSRPILQHPTYSLSHPSGVVTKLPWASIPASYPPQPSIRLSSNQWFHPIRTSWRPMSLRNSVSIHTCEISRTLGGRSKIQTYFKKEFKHMAL